MFQRLVRGANKVARFAVNNSSTILIGVATTGFVATVVTAIKATPYSLDAVDNKNTSLDDAFDSMDCGCVTEEEYKEIRRDIYKEFTKDMVKIWWPTVTLGTLSIASVIFAHKIDLKKQAALSAALTMTEGKFKEYQSKVIETIGEKKEEKIRNDIAKDAVRKTQMNEILSTGHGDTLVLDKATGRYFYCNAEFIRRTVNKLNQRLITEMWISLNDLYYELGLETISIGDDIGWNISDDGLIEISFDSVLNEDERPVLVLDYLVRPRSNYRRW